MKRKILFATIISIVFIMTFALCAFAVDYNEKATLADGTVLPIYDENQNPLIWWISGEENGKNVYSSVPNNRKEPNANNDTYVTYTNGNGNQLRDITFYIYDEASGTYIPYTDKDLKLVVVNLRGLTGFVYLHQNFNFKNIQCIYFHEELLDCCKFFAGSTDLRLVDLTVCTKMTGGFGGVRNFYNCTNLHTIRLAPGASYSLKCSQNNNWRFSGTAVVSFVFPENITNLGIDNFKDNSKLESIYILGNNTSLGQRNFLNCPNLTNIYILGDDPQITTTEFAENFYSCVDGNKVLDFSNTGKYFFFATENSEYLENMRAAIEATAVVSYSSYKANPQNYTEGRYIISGITECDALYKGEHEAGQAVNGCQAECQRCGALTVIENPTHVGVKTVTYGGKAEINYLSEIVVTVKCEKCGTVESEIVINNLFEEKGYSTEIDSVGIVREFVVNLEAIESYKQNVDSTFEYGMVVSIEGTTPLTIDKDGVVAPSNEYVVAADFTSNDYKKLQMKVVNISAEAMDTVIVSTVYARLGDEIYYANMGNMSKIAEGKTYNSLKK